VALLQQAPADAELARMFPSDTRPLADREREFFVRASTWPDFIRPIPAYHHKFWHYRDFFWRQAGGQIVNLPDPIPDPGEAVDQLARLAALVVTTDPGRAGDRALGVAWLAHIAGDIHQPLHCSARVTSQEPRGDGGGNTFKLQKLFPGSPAAQDRESLHSYWDGGVDKAVPAHPNEPEMAHVARVAAIAMTAHPKASMATRLNSGQFERWCRESLAIAQAVAYPSTLKRLERPRASYRVRVGTVALEQVVLGGYRLAALLDSLFRQ
jgi:hypothetical protein